MILVPLHTSRPLCSGAGTTLRDRNGYPGTCIHAHPQPSGPRSFVKMQVKPSLTTAKLKRVYAVLGTVPRAFYSDSPKYS